MGSQVVLRRESVQIVSQRIDGMFPDSQVLLTKGLITRTEVAAAGLLIACKQARASLLMGLTWWIFIWSSRLVLARFSVQVKVFPGIIVEGVEYRIHCLQVCLADPLADDRYPGQHGLFHLAGGGLP